MSKLDDIFNANTVALTKYTVADWKNLKETHTVTDYDTVVLNQFETKKQIKDLMLEMIDSASEHPDDKDLQTYDDYGIAITYTDKLKQKVEEL